MELYDSAREEIVATAQKLVAKGYLMATGGNLSLHIGKQSAFAITPSNYDYMKMTPEDVCVLDLDLCVLAGARKPSVEAAMHSAIYQVRPDVHAIIHAHQTYASALSLIGESIPPLFDEQVRFLGRKVEIIPYAPSGTAALRKTVLRHIKNHHNAYMIRNHGVLVFGGDIQRAALNTEILDKCALAYLLTLCSGRNVSKIPLVVREVAMSKLRQDQKAAEGG